MVYKKLAEEDAPKTLFEIRNKIIDREEAKSLVKQYDGEFQNLL